MTEPPVLSICIPTYRRPHHLKNCLSAIAGQVIEQKGKVQIVISDNFSNDATREVVESSPARPFIKYHCNPENIGGNRNIELCLKVLAEGKFAWVIGDDDIIRGSSVAKVVDVIETHPEIDYIYANYVTDNTSKDDMDRILAGKTPLEKATVIGSTDYEERVVDPWEKLLAVDRVSLTCLYTSVVRISVIRQNAETVTVGNDFVNLSSTFPHLLLLINSLTGHKAYKFGLPLVICGVDASWKRYDFAVLMRVMEIYDYEEGHGISRALVDPQRRRFARKNTGYLLRTLLLERIKNSDMPMVHEFSLKDYLLANARYREFWIALMKEFEEFFTWRLDIVR